MVSSIQELLFQHDCVIVPGLGAFIANYQPSKVKLYESKIYPPCKAIAFNRSLKNNDGLLIAYAARKENSTYKQAEEKVNTFVQSCLTGLEKNQSFLFKDIGRLFYDSNQNLLFEPAETVNYLIQTNSLPALEIAPIERLKTSIEDLRPKIENDKDVEKILEEIESSQRVKNKKSTVPYWITFVLAIGLLSSVIGISLIQGDFSNISRSSFFPDFDSLMGKEEMNITKPVIQPQPVKVVPTVTQESAPVVETIPAAETVKPPAEVVTPAPAEKAVEAVNIPKAYIVIGAFFDQKYAERTKAEASEKGYHAVQLDEYDGTLHRVMIESNVQQVDADLAAIKSSLNARAWVYCTYCSH